MKNVLDKSSRKNQNTHLMFSDFFFSKSFHLGDNLEKYVKLDRPRMTIRSCTESVIFACRITEARIETYVYNG